MAEFPHLVDVVLSLLLISLQLSVVSGRVRSVPICLALLLRLLLHLLRLSLIGSNSPRVLLLVDACVGQSVLVNLLLLIVVLSLKPLLIEVGLSLTLHADVPIQLRIYLTLQELASVLVLLLLLLLRQGGLLLVYSLS